MKKNFWLLMKIAPALAIAGSALGVELAQANEVNNEINWEQIKEYNKIKSMGQVTSVDQLSDVSPTDWAYEALRSLVERYGCIVGYPDSTFRGNRALSRYEFAAGLNACMQQMERLLAASEAVIREDIEKLKRLMKEFEAELVALGARVDNLEGRVAFLEDHQFSTTTKLKGEVILALTSEFNNNQAIMANRVRLDLNTSFTGEDILITRIAAGSNKRFNSEFISDSSTLLQNFNVIGAADNARVADNDAVVDWIGYYNNIKFGDNKKLQLYVAGHNGIHSDYVSTLNPYFEDYDGGNGALSVFASRSPIYRIGSGVGGALSFTAENWLKGTTISAGYLNANGDNPSNNRGLDDGDWSVLAQIDSNITENVSLGFTFVRAFHNGLSGGLFGDLVGSFEANRRRFESYSYGFQGSWRIHERVSFSAFGMFSDFSNADDEAWSYGGGFAFPDLGKEGNLLGIYAGVQPYSGDFSAAPGGSIPVHVEAFYKYRVNDNISITPGIIWVSSPEQLDNEDDAIIGTIRTTFSF